MKANWRAVSQGLIPTEIDFLVFVCFFGGALCLLCICFISSHYTFLFFKKQLKTQRCCDTSLLVLDKLTTQIPLKTELEKSKFLQDQILESPSEYHRIILKYIFKKKPPSSLNAVRKWQTNFLALKNECYCQILSSSRFSTTAPGSTKCQVHCNL